MSEQLAHRLHSARRRGGADVAVDKGFAAAEGLDVELVREVSWSNVRDKLNIGLFDAAHLMAPMAIASSLGLGHVKVPIVAPFALGRERQRHHGVARAACGAGGGGRRRHRRPDGIGAGAGARGRRSAQGTRRGAAHLRHDVSVLDAQLSSAILDGGRRRRSRRGRAACRTAAALHGGEPAEQARRRLLRRRAVEFGRGRSRASATSCISSPKSLPRAAEKLLACAQRWANEHPDIADATGARASGSAADFVEDVDNRDEVAAHPRRAEPHRRRARR